MKAMNWMIIGLVVVVAVVLLLPTFGVAMPTGNISLLLIIVLLACCVLPMLFMRHGRNRHEKSDKNPSHHNM